MDAGIRTTGALQPLWFALSTQRNVTKVWYHIRSYNILTDQTYLSLRLFEQEIKNIQG